MIWRVGNGSTTRIWKDRWLPTSNTCRVSSPIAVLNSDATVRELIDEDLKWWNVPFLETIFTKEEAQLIQTIPLSCTNQEDILIWKGTANGVFYVRSAYHMQKETETLAIAESSSKRGFSEVWKKLWALPIPNVEKNFHLASLS